MSIPNFTFAIKYKWNYAKIKNANTSHFFAIKNRLPPILPHRYQCRIFGRLMLNRRVRDGNGCFHQAYRNRNGTKWTRTTDLSVISRVL